MSISSSLVSFKSDIWTVVLKSNQRRVFAFDTIGQIGATILLRRLERLGALYNRQLGVLTPEILSRVEYNKRYL